MARGSIVPILIAVVLFAALATGGVSFIGGLNDNYGELINTSDFSESFGNITLNQIENSAEIVNQSVDPSSEGSFEQSEATGIGWTWKKITSFVGQVKVIGTVATTSASNANKDGVLNGMLPSWFTTSIILIIVFMIIGAIISIILRKEV